MPSTESLERPTVTADDPKAAGPSSISELCVVDLGEHSQRSVKRLRRGEGRLMDKVEDAILNLREEGILVDGDIQTVVVVVREESSFSNFLSRDEDDDDDDDDDD
jgi:hypothetical protein